jgi:hypothetical protein
LHNVARKAVSLSHVIFKKRVRFYGLTLH